MPRHVNIFGDMTDNPDEFVHCAKCYAISALQIEEAVCGKCGSDLTTNESIIIGHALRLMRVAEKAKELEWIELNAPFTK